MQHSSAPALDIEHALGVIVSHLAGQEGVHRVWLFGSWAKGRKTDWRSDIDIAVEGLDPSLLGRAWSELDAQIRQPLDLIRFEDASDALKREITTWGRLLYG